MVKNVKNLLPQFKPFRLLSTNYKIDLISVQSHFVRCLGMSGESQLCQFQISLSFLNVNIQQKIFSMLWVLKLIHWHSVTFMLINNSWGKYFTLTELQSQLKSDSPKFKSNVLFLFLTFPGKKYDEANWPWNHKMESLDDRVW